MGLFTVVEPFFTPFLTGLGLGLLPDILTTVLVVLLDVRRTGFDELLLLFVTGLAELLTLLEEDDLFEVLFTVADFLVDRLLVEGLRTGVLVVGFSFDFTFTGFLEDGFFLTEELDVLLLIVEELLDFEPTRVVGLAILFTGAFFLFLTLGLLVCTWDISFFEGGFL
ncbi:MAG: hypothetical protein ACTSPM_07880, partial [Candidatus Heimdallarchaeota archaeon]